MELGSFVMGMGLLAFGASVQAATPPKHVMVVLFENSSVGDVIGLPFFAQFAAQGAALMNFHAESHPSQPNYIGLISGDMYGVTDDSNVTISAQHLGDLLEAKGLTWKVYAEALPSTPCYKGAHQSTYWRKHEPFISFKNIQNTPSRCANIVNANVLASDIAAGKLPNFSLYIPDINNDGHDTGPTYADKWFSGKFGPLLKDRHFMQDMLVVATFDEGDDSDPGNQIYTALYGDSIAVGTRSQVNYNHYSLLSMFETIFGLGNLGLADAKASQISDVWKR